MAYVIDLREIVIDFPPQPVITKDNVTMQIDTVVYYQITDPVRYVFEIANPIVLFLINSYNIKEYNR